MANNRLRLRWRVPPAKLVSMVEVRCNMVLDKFSMELVNYIVEKISTSCPPHSDPGMPPNVETGNLRRNIAWETPSYLRRRIGTGVGNASSVGYAMWLEFGTRTMAPRPFLRPSLDETRDELTEMLKDAFAVGVTK